MDSKSYWRVDVRDKIVVDIGAYIGDSALYFLSRGARTVYSHEPSARYYRLAKENTKPFKNVRLFNFGGGLGDSNATLVGQVMGKTIGEGRGEMVEVRDFGRVMKEILEEEGKIDLLKVDCEGCEWEIFEGMDEMLAELINSIFVEVHGLRDRLVLVSKLKGFGYELISADPYYFKAPKSLLVSN